MTTTIKLRSATLIVAALSAGLGLPGRAQAADIRLECDAEGAGDISMSARYEDRRGRERFDTEFEAAPGGDFGPGQTMNVIVRKVIVGSVKLKTARNGDIVGDLNLGRDGKPIPEGFPKVKSGTPVQVQIDGGVVLGCKVRPD
jgi:hypothetical protein